MIKIYPKSHSQRTKVLNILTTLQRLEPIIKNFDDRSFQSSLIVPVFNIKKKKNKWIVSVALAKELYLYSYPFQSDTPDKTILSIIREDGVHISSFSVDKEVLREIIKDNFWVLKGRNL